MDYAVCCPHWRQERGTWAGFDERGLFAAVADQHTGGPERIRMSRGRLLLYVLGTCSDATSALDLLERELGRGAEHLADSDLVVVYPATFNINKLAREIAVDAVATLCAATPLDKLLAAPAMNLMLFENPLLQESLSKLRELGAAVVDPRIEEGAAEVSAEEGAAAGGGEDGGEHGGGGGSVAAPAAAVVFEAALQTGPHAMSREKGD